jgi:phosphoribosylanthranilate isomerase
MAMAGASIYLLDSALLGGGGQLFNWEVAREVCRQRRVIIAGGLDSENVGQLIREIRPWGVDVSSGVETDGRKDPGKIKKFIGAVGAADKEVNLVTR